MSDPISEMLINLKNASAAGKEFAVFTLSKQKESILKIFEKQGYIDSYTVDSKIHKIKAKLKKDQYGPYFSYVKRISSPGRRIYVKSKDIPFAKTNSGIIIVSTPFGIMTGFQAKRKGLGGELICEVS